MKKVTVYVPATQGVGSATDNMEMVERTAKVLSVFFGGATAVKTQGFYVAESGELITEGTVKVYSYVPKDREENIQGVKVWCEELKKAMEQECVLMTVEEVTEVNFI